MNSDKFYSILQRPPLSLSLSLSLKFSSLAATKNIMDYSSSNDVHVPRWTPKSSRASSPLRASVVANEYVGDLEMQSIDSVEEDDGRCPNVEETFPFNVAGLGTFGAPVRLDVHETSFKFGSEVVSSGTEQDQNYVEKREGNIFLTWKDLWVTVPNGESGRRPIVQGLTGYAEPGNVLAIMDSWVPLALENQLCWTLWQVNLYINKIIIILKSINACQGKIKIIF